MDGAVDPPTTAGPTAGSVTLRLRLDRLIAELSAAGYRPSVKEIAEAISVALDAADLVETAPHRLAVRLRSVLVKRPVPAQRQAFDRAFESAFGGPAEVTTPQSRAADATDAPEARAPRRHRPDGKPDGAQGATGSASLWQRVRRIGGMVVLIAALFGGIGTVGMLILPIWITATGPGDGANTRPSGSTGTSADGGGGDATAAPPSSLDLSDRQTLETIVFDLGLLATRDGALNIARVASDLRVYRPLGMTPEQVAVALARETLLAPSYIVQIDGPDFPDLVLAIAKLSGFDPDIGRDAADSVIRRSVTALNTAVAELSKQVVSGTAPFADRFANIGNAPRALMLDLPEGEMRDAFSRLLPALGPDSLRFMGPAAVNPTGVGRSWWLYPLALVPLIAAIWWRIATWRRRMRAWFRKRAPDHGVTPHYLGGLQEALDRAVGSDTRVRAARDLARPIRVTTRRIDAERTALLSARNGGRLSPVMREARKTPCYLALIVTEGPDDHLAIRFRELVRAFDRLRTTIDCWYIDQDGDTVFQHYEDRRRTLDDLYRRLPDRRLLVLGNGHGFLDTATGAARPWASLLLRWSGAAILTPVPRDSWGPDEAVLAALFRGRIAEASPDGLAEISAALADDTTPELRAVGAQAPPLWDEETGVLVRHDMPDAHDLERLDGELHDALGPEGMLWLRAAAVYPSINWDLTLYLGQELTSGPGRTPLITPRRFARLAALPWFREGYMPPWARRWLTGGLSEADRRDVITLLCGRLIEATERPADSAAEAAFVTPGDVQGDKGLRRDAVFLEMLSDTPPAGERMEATLDLAEQFAAPRRAFQRRELIIVGLLGLYGAGLAVALFIHPIRAGGVPGEYLGLLAMGAGALFLSYGLRALLGKDAEAGG